MKFEAREQTDNFFIRRVSPWLRLCRLPNVPTVPGDILAGYVLAGGAANFNGNAVLGIMILSLSLYLSGLFLNDWCDQKIPDRHGPARLISRQGLPCTRWKTATHVVAAEIRPVLLQGHDAHDCVP